MIRKLLFFGVYIVVPISVLAGAVGLINTSGFVALTYKWPQMSSISSLWLVSDRLASAIETQSVMNMAKDANELTNELVIIQSPTGGLLYGEDEIEHLVDVYYLLRTVRLIGIVSILIIVVSGLVFYTNDEFQLHLRRALKLTLGLLFTISVLLLLVWSWFFDIFHRLLFPVGTWTFPYSSGLIQLFPEFFWQFTGISLIIVMSLLVGLVWIGINTKRI